MKQEMIDSSPELRDQSQIPSRVLQPQHMAPRALVADGKTLSSEPNRLGHLKPTDAGVGIEAIREIYEEHGYVWLKGFLRRAGSSVFVAGSSLIWRIRG